jgi:hypothetical protein
MVASLVLGGLMAQLLAPSELLMTASGSSLVARGALAAALDRQLASTQLESDPVRIGLTFETLDGHLCRSFELRSSGTAGLGCKVDGEWRIPVTSEAPAHSGDVRQAASLHRGARVIRSAVSGAPFDAVAEERARRRLDRRESLGVQSSGSTSATNAVAGAGLSTSGSQAASARCRALARALPAAVGVIARGAQSSRRAPLTFDATRRADRALREFAGVAGGGRSAQRRDVRERRPARRGAPVRACARKCNLMQQAAHGVDARYSVCISTSPGFSPRPARPATWMMVWATRSGARKSVLNKPWSALSTTTRVTLGKSWPLVTICVPTRMRASPLATRLTTDSRSPRRRTTSRSRRAMGMVGNSPASVSSTRSVLANVAHRVTHCGQFAGSAGAAVVARSFAAARCCEPRRNRGKCNQPQAVQASVGE